jgi:hypothetical protein
MGHFLLLHKALTIHDFYFAVLFMIRRQWLSYNCVGCLFFTSLNPLLLVFRFLVTVAAIYGDPFLANSFVALCDRLHTFHLLRVIKSVIKDTTHTAFAACLYNEPVCSKLMTGKFIS